MLAFPENLPTTAPRGRPWRFLSWIYRRLAAQLTLATALSALQLSALAMTPYLLGQAVDQGLDQGLTAAVWRYAGLLLALGVFTAAAAAARHVAEVSCWMNGAFTCSHLVGTHVTRTGRGTTKDMSTGEVVATVATDSFHMGNLMETTPNVLGGLVAYALVAGLMLRDSVPLGLAVLIGLPIVTAIVALLIPPLQRRQQKHREATGKLTELASDTVSGLRVLRGIGGEDVFTARYAAQSQRVRTAGVGVANTQSVLAALQVLLPGVFVVGVVWFGATLVVGRQLTVGQLVAFYGYTAFLAEPLRQVTQFIQFLTRARVAAGRFDRVLALSHPAASDDDAASPTLPDLPAAGDGAWLLQDASTGLAVRPGALTVVVSRNPDVAAAAVRHLARVEDDAACVELAGRPLNTIPLAALRRQIVLSDATPELFTGTLRTEVDSWDSGDEQAVLRSLRAADALDVVDSLPEGLEGTIAEKGRSLSGGQRQRVALARALATRAPVLLLIEPTSAVDAHTERRIAAALRQERAGRTTVVVTASPLVLERADDVVVLDETGVRTRGTHRELLARARDGQPDAAEYRAIVTREVDHAASGC